VRQFVLLEESFDSSGDFFPWLCGWKLSPARSAALDQEEAVRVMVEKFEICRDFFYRFDWSAWKSTSAADTLSLIPAAQEHILALCAKERNPETHKACRAP
jgi:hypothetical protein